MLFGVLGPVQAYDSLGATIELGARKPTTLLSALLLHANAWVSVDRLIDAAWHEQDTPASAERNVKTYIWRLRRVLPEPCIDSRPGAYRIRVKPGDLDIHAMESHEAAADGIGAPVAHLTEALRLWRGRPYAELPDHWAGESVAHFTQMRWRLREKLADAYTCQGQHDQATDLLRILTREEPLREGPWARLVLSLHAAGRRAEALATFQHVRSVLVAELGVEPGPELAAAHRAVLLADATTCRRDLPRTVPDFTGRTAELARLGTLLREHQTSVPVLVLHGMPGVGKTALAVHAAHRLPGDQLFVDLRAHDPRGPLDPADVLARLLRATGAAVPSDVDERAALWRSSLTGRRLLLVLDDAADADQVRPLLPGSPGCAVVITARTRLPGLEGIETLNVDPLPDAAAAQLFDGAASAETLGRCGGLPAAIRAASAPNRPLWTSNWLAGELAPLFEPSLRRLTEAERDMLLLVSTRGRIDAWTAARLSGLAVPVARRVLELLCDRHLLAQSAPGRFDCHVVVREQARRMAFAGHQVA